MSPGGQAPVSRSRSMECSVGMQAVDCWMLAVPHDIAGAVVGP